MSEHEHCAQDWHRCDGGGKGEYDRYTQDTTPAFLAAQGAEAVPGTEGGSTTPDREPSGDDQDAHGDDVRHVPATRRPDYAACPDCGGAVVEAEGKAACTRCGRGVRTATRATRRRSGRVSRLICTHPRWRYIGTVTVNGERRVVSRCARCGEERQVEA